MTDASPCFTIWFSQRTGSTWLCQALSSTNVAGHPREWFNTSNPADLPDRYGVTSVPDLIAKLRQEGTTPNGIFGLKQGISQPYFEQLLSLLGEAARDTSASRIGIWETAFPNHKHVFMTRRNKVRLAVSWWRAICSGEWHRRRGENISAADLTDAYNFKAIDHLLSESILREAAIQELFDEAEIVPLTVTYEDMVIHPEATVQNVLRYIGCDESASVQIATDYERLSDGLSEEWVQRYRHEKQANWQNKGW